MIVFSQAEISVVICNQGVEAIDRERFGRFITIVRRITINSNSQYTIKNEFGTYQHHRRNCSSRDSLILGRVVGTKRDLIENIVAHFNIQVDNPMCMLNQDVAKNFLNTKSIKEKYNVRR
jgi:structural maintenance of chromosomes protein 6